MKNVLEKLVTNSQNAINEGIYEISENLTHSNIDLAKEISENHHASLITEIKFASPSLGKISEVRDPVEIAKSMIRGGAKALSILTQPHLFNGSPELFMKVRKEINIPLLMKDIIIDKSQINAAKKIGADYILLIQSLFDNGYLKEIEELIDYAHKKDLKVLVESHTKQEFQNMIKTNADIYGINNRNLDTLEIDLNTTKIILEEQKKSKLIIAESGIESPDHIQFLKKCGADAFLVGSSIMKSDNIEKNVKELVEAI